MVRLGIAASEFHWDIVGPMLDFAKRHAEFLGAKVKDELIVPGTFELPQAAKKLASDGEIDAVVALGAVIEGDTQHDEIVMQHASRKLMDLSIELGKPMTLGISGPGETRLQAQERINEYAKRAVEAAVKMVERTTGC
ncbi:6,7-dimethyl-8-ribityllumazine synthase [candidate division MSBL1 archaeon SCGC-AAA261F19]|uniref:6,7-dimethyl-8-ribityllumazine synthase n=1 Tax=candidate division MSBL1 archaeon SCGC-AAA261F19 TaxID=1698275 RepID=A0A133VAR3_9EURY|nr:6,7-dimethyl-8-ribityllumazine synthase [candidate division MSBL1 archaeon SCGC-AAA261F19]